MTQVISVRLYRHPRHSNHQNALSKRNHGAEQSPSILLRLCSASCSQTAPPSLHTKVLQYGDVVFLCPVGGCPQIYVYPRCKKVGEGYACHQHKSSMLCAGCLRPFVLKEHGIIKLHYRIPRYVMKRQYCAPCYRGTKVFLLSILRFVRAHRYPVPRQVLEHIIWWWWWWLKLNKT